MRRPAPTPRKKKRTTPRSSPDDCTSGICCAKVVASSPSACDALASFNGSHCKTSCGNDEVSLCWGGGAQACGSTEACVGAHLYIDYEKDGSLTPVLVGYCRKM